MPNGGHISCDYCTCNRRTPGRCDIFGVETSPFLLCRSFRKAQQPHTAAQEEYPLLRKLEPGIVYQIDNSAAKAGDPSPAYRVVPVE